MSNSGNDGLDEVTNRELATLTTNPELGLPHFTHEDILAEGSRRIERSKPLRPVCLEPEIAQALEEWVIALMGEREGPGITVEVVTAEGKVIDNSWAISDCFAVIYTVAPDVIARCLQAGAAAYIREEDHLP